MGGDGRRDAGVRVENAVRTPVEMPRVAPRAAELGPGTPFFHAAEWTESAVHGVAFPGAGTGGVEERGWGEAGTTAQHTVRPPGRGPPVWPRVAKQGPGMNMLATRT